MNAADLRRLPVLAYHSVSSASAKAAIDRAAFVEQMKWLACHGWTAISAQRAARQPLPKRPVVLTFDDGYADFSETVTPILAQLGFTATVFIIPGFIDERKRYLSHRLMDWDAVCEVSKQGMEVGSHTCSHFLLLNAGREAANEIGASKWRIEDKLGREIDSFAYPKGLYVDGVKKLVAMAGYQRAYVLDGQRWVRSDLFTLRRVCITRNDTLLRFAVKMNSAYRCLVDIGLRGVTAQSVNRAVSAAALETEENA